MANIYYGSNTVGLYYGDKRIENRSFLTKTGYIKILPEVASIIEGRNVLNPARSALQMSAEAVGLDFDISKLKWAIENEKIATINDNGLVASLNPGKTKVLLLNSAGKIYSSRDLEVKMNTDFCPYVSTYYFNPKPYDTEENIIPFYITDWHQKEYMELDDSLKFTLIYELDGVLNRVPNLSAGDNNINFGILSEGIHWFSLQVEDGYGRVSHRLYNELWVVNEKNYRIKPEEIYTMTLSDLMIYKIKKNNSKVEDDMNNVRLGFSQLFKDIRDRGYRKCIIQEGYYRFNKCARMGTGDDKPLIIPSGLTIDLNGSTFKQHPFSGHESCFFRFDKCIDSHLANGTLEGDYIERQANGWLSNYNGEGAGTVQMQGGRYNSMQNIKIISTTGYSLMTTFGRCDLTSFPKGWKENCKAVGDDEFLEVGKSLSPFADITKILNSTFDNKYLTVSKYLGYQGISTSSWYFEAHFYDENKMHIETIKAHQYRRIRIPEGSKFLRITILGVYDDTTAAELRLTIHNMELPHYCLYKNLEMENTRTCAIAFCQMNNFLIENLTFKKCGQSITPAAIDFEDGWQQMQDLYMRDCQVLERSGTACIIDNSGFNHVYERLDNFRFILRRPHGSVVKNCTNSVIRLDTNFQPYTGFTRVHNNNLNSATITKSSDFVRVQIIKDCDFDGDATGIVGYSKYLRCNFVTPVSKKSSLQIGEYEDCLIENKSGENHGGIYNNCIFNNVIGNLHGQLSTNNCTIKGFSVNLGRYEPAMTFKNSTLTNIKLAFTYWHNGAIILFDNCDISSSDTIIRLPNYAMDFPIVFKNSRITTTTTTGLIWFYDDRTNANTAPDKYPVRDKVILENNIINIPDSRYLITGLTKTTANHIKVDSFNNNVTPPTILLCDPLARENPNIIIVES